MAELARLEREGRAARGWFSVARSLVSAWCQRLEPPGHLGLSTEWKVGRSVYVHRAFPAPSGLPAPRPRPSLTSSLEAPLPPRAPPAGPPTRRPVCSGRSDPGWLSSGSPGGLQGDRGTLDVAMAVAREGARLAVVSGAEVGRGWKVLRRAGDGDGVEAGCGDIGAGGAKGERWLG